MASHRVVGRVSLMGRKTIEGMGGLVGRTIPQLEALVLRKQRRMDELEQQLSELREDKLLESVIEQRDKALELLKQAKCPYGCDAILENVGMTTVCPGGWCDERKALEGGE